MQDSREHGFRIEEEMPFLDPIIARWFNGKYSKLTEPQRRAIPLIHERKNVLVSSPTGTGKTLTGFLAIINELFRFAREGTLRDTVYCVYISPLKALANDIDRNLNQPLREIMEISKEEGMELPQIRVSVRSGDTKQSDRQRMLRKPPHILITTPESFSLVLTAPKFREKLRTVRYVIVDEIHEVSSTKRGSLLSANLERLRAVTDEDFVRIGLSATQAPLDEIAKYLCGFDGEVPRPFEIVDVDTKKYLDLRTIVPVHDLTKVSSEVANERMYDILTDLINRHRTTLIFTNTRSGTEHVAIKLKARGIESVEAHHSSLGKETRLDVEDRLKRGELRCVITSTSLELGIDIGYIDLVVQIGSPKSVSKGLQRIGRSGHGIDELSKGRFLVFDLDDLMECAVLTKAAYDREIDRVTIPRNPLDVLSQVLVGMSLEKVWGIEEAYRTLKNSYSFHTLEWDDYMSVLRYLAGQIEDSTIYSKIWLDEGEGTFGKKKSTRMIFFMNVGTIPEDADYQVVGERGRHLGQLSDKFVERLKQGDIFVLGARTYMFLRTSRNLVYVKDATGMRPTVPTWTGEMLPRSYDLGVLVGRFREEAVRKIQRGEDVRKWLMEDYRLDEWGADSLISYIKGQMKYGVPTHRHLLVEGYIDRDNLYSVIFHVPLGRRVNDALSRAYAQAASNRYGSSARVTVTDDGFMVTLSEKPDLREFVHLVTSSSFDDTVRASIRNTETFKQRFRHCASRALMVLRRYKGTDISVVRQQLRSDRVLRTIGEMEGFPVVKETFHEIMEDMMDVPRARQYISEVIERGNYRVLDYTAETSPFSYGIILAGVSDLVLMEDRSRVLRELQNRILDKIYGPGEIRYIFRDDGPVREFFASLVPRVRDMESYEAMARHFLHIDPFRNRQNSPYPYSDTDAKAIGEELIEKDRIVSAFARMPVWCHIDNYPILRTLFRDASRVRQEDLALLEHCNGTTLSELKRDTGLSEEDIRESMNRLEAAYLVRRKLRGGVQVFIRNDLEAQDMDREEALRAAVRRVLHSYGPLTIEEVLIRIPVGQEEVERALDAMVSSGEITRDFVTPVFAPQFILREDLERLTGMQKRDIRKDRVFKMLQPASDVNDYFMKYGYASSTWDLRARGVTVTTGQLASMVGDRSLVYGRFVKNKYVYMHPELAKALHTLRREEAGDELRSVYRAIENGAWNESQVSAVTGLPKKVVREAVKDLEYYLAVCRLPDGGLRPLYGLDSYGDPSEAMSLLVRMFGPATQEELSRHFWFYASRFVNSIKETVSQGGEVYYGSTGEYSGRGSIVSTGDPVTIFLEKFYTDRDSNGRFIAASGNTYQVEVRESADAVVIEKFEEMPGEDFVDLCRLLVSLVSGGTFRVSVVRGISGGEAGVAEGLGLRASGDTAVYGEVDIEDMDEGSLLSLALARAMRRSGEIPFAVMNGRLEGFRSALEAVHSGISPTDVRSHQESSLLLSFNGPFDIVSLGTLGVVALYRALREREMDEGEKEIVRIVLESSGATESEIVSASVHPHLPRVRIKALFQRDVLAKDYERRYIVVPEKYRRREAMLIFLRYLLKNYGFFDAQRYSEATGNEVDSDFVWAVSRLHEEGSARRVFVRDLGMVMYVSTERRKRPEGLFISGPKDFITRYFSRYLRARFGSLNLYFIFMDGQAVAAVKVKKSGESVTIEKVIGDRKYRDVFRKEMNAFGISATFS